ncbi:MAG: glycosyltransferase [Gemmataceae bacterium]
MAAPLRVIHVTLGLDIGGQEKLLVEFARHADRARFDLHFLSLTGRGVLATDIEALGWPVTALEAPSGLRPDLVLRLARWFRRHGAQVVHTHDDRPNIHAAPAARMVGVPRVIHTRHHQGTVLTRRQQRLVRAVSLCDHSFVCISHDSLEVARQQGIAPHRLRMIHNGIDLEKFAFGGPDSAGYAVLVARLSEVKSIDTLLDAATLLKSRHPDFQLRIAGDGPCRTELEAQIRRLDLHDSVRLLGEVRDIPGLLAKARLFVLPSRSEGISLTLLEAMARGLPVVATRVGGNSEVVAEGTTGWLVPPRSPRELADAIARIWTDPVQGEKMGRAGRKRVEEKFDIRTMVATYEALYTS